MSKIDSGIARAIDAGFGVMKFTRRATPKEEQDGLAVCGVVFDSFPSVALDADTQTQVDGSASRDTVVVEYDGRSYEAGRGIRHAMVASDFGRDMTDSYYDSPVYHALMRAALAHMKEAQISTLVLGLPMNHFENKARVAKLQEQYTGKISLGGGRFVTIDKAIVHPQPFGGYIGLGSDLDGINAALAKYPNCGIAPLKSTADLKKLNVLIVDPGEFTLDWLYMTPGGQAQKVSNAISDAGRHRVLREVLDKVEQKLGRPIGASFLSDIDVALRNGGNFRIGGQAFDLHADEYANTIKLAVEDPVRQLFGGLRGVEDRIDLVAVLGGSPHQVADAIRATKPLLPLYCHDGKGQSASLFANLRGFQEWAETVDAQHA